MLLIDQNPTFELDETGGAGIKYSWEDDGAIHVGVQDEEGYTMHNVAVAHAWG